MVNGLIGKPWSIFKKKYKLMIQLLSDKLVSFLTKFYASSITKQIVINSFRKVHQVLILIKSNLFFRKFLIQKIT